MKENQDSQDKKQQTTKICSKCGDTKSLDQMYKYQQCRTCYNAYQKAYKRRNKKKCYTFVASATLKRKYGISLSQYDELFEAQNGLCAICCKTQKKKRLAVDHNHETGEIRGLLCDKCNRAIGLLGDSIGNLTRAIDYLHTRGSYGS